MLRGTQFVEEIPLHQAKENAISLYLHLSKYFGKSMKHWVENLQQIHDQLQLGHVNEAYTVSPLSLP